MAPELEAFRQEFDAVAADAGGLLAPLSDAQFYWSPSPERWSVAQCVEHLNVTARNYLPMLDDAIASAKRWGVYGNGPFNYGWLGPWFVRTMDPPVRRRFKAPPIFQPTTQAAPPRKRTDIEAAFRGYQVQFVDRLRQANGVDLAKARVRSPASKWLRLPLGSAFALMAAHERRHLWQARQLLARPDYPRASSV
ncbi:MAG TPA: DinB family protein [Vicinamibacterales bacterium]